MVSGLGGGNHLQERKGLLFSHGGYIHMQKIMRMFENIFPLHRNICFALLARENLVSALAEHFFMVAVVGGRGFLYGVFPKPSDGGP